MSWTSSDAGRSEFTTKDDVVALPKDSVKSDLKLQIEDFIKVLSDVILP